MPPDLHDFLAGEGYLIATAGAVERRLQKLLPPARMRDLRKAWKGRGGARQAAIHRWPVTAEEAHLLFSYDIERVLLSFDWLADQALASQSPGDVVDLGCATGSLLRFLAASGEARPLVGIDAASNLVGIARALSPGIRFVESPYSAVPPGEVNGAVLLSACGLDLGAPDMDRAEHEATLAGRPDPERLAFWADQAAADLAAWHGMALPGASLHCVVRLPLLPDLVGFLEAAAGAGWSLDLPESRYLAAEFPPLPALSFRRTEPARLCVGIDALSEWQRSFWPSRDEDLAMADW